MTDVRGMVLGAGVSVLDVVGVASAMAEAGRARGGYVTVCNVHSIVTATHDAELQQALTGSIANIADGMPLVWALRLLGQSTAKRVPGRDLMVHVLEHGSPGLTRHFLLGSTEQVQGHLVKVIERRFPSALVVGRWVPPFSADGPELPESVRETILESRADVVWVGLGCPRQEKWMLRHWRALSPAVLVGVGAAFDFLAGNKGVAPAWMQNLGLEWLFRLLSEPRRLLRRYASTNSVFVLRLAAQIFRERLRSTR